MWTVIKGDPINGFSLHNLFSTEQEAMAWGTMEFETDPDWWPIELELTGIPAANSDLTELTAEQLAKLEEVIDNAPKMPRAVSLDLSEIPESV
jgi:hypothetical protein